MVRYIGDMPTFPSSWWRLTAQAKTEVDLPARKFKRILLTVALTLFLAPSAARADPIRMQCWDCLQRVAMELPAVNPQEDPSYEQGLTPGSVLPALTTCSLDDSQIPDLRRIIQVFTDAQVKSGGVSYVRQQLEHMPEVSSDDRAKLIDGARQDLDTTHRHLVDHNCRILLQAHFDEGGSRAWLLHMIDIGRGSDDR